MFWRTVTDNDDDDDDNDDDSDSNDNVAVLPPAEGRGQLPVAVSPRQAAAALGQSGHQHRLGLLPGNLFYSTVSRVFRDISVF